MVNSVIFNHSYIPGSTNPNKSEVVKLRYRGIEWNYLPGNIKSDDYWDKVSK